jgi:hypothetical protein
VAHAGVFVSWITDATGVIDAVGRGSTGDTDLAASRFRVVDHVVGRDVDRSTVVCVGLHPPVDFGISRAPRSDEKSSRQKTRQRGGGGRRPVGSERREHARGGQSEKRRGDRFGAIAIFECKV